MKSEKYILAESLIGKRVKVIKNSERLEHFGMVGMCGYVDRSRAADCHVSFDNGATMYIFVEDLVEMPEKLHLNVEHGELSWDDELKQIGDIVKARFGDAVSVSIFINAQEAAATIEYRSDIGDYSMQTLNGGWCSRR